MEYKEIIEKLPKGWNEITLEQYLRILSIEIDQFKNDDIELEGVNNLDFILEVAKEILDIHISDIRTLQMNEIIEICKALSFIESVPEPLKKSRYNWKKEVDLSFDNFIQLNTIIREEDYIKQLPDIIKLTMIGDEDINVMTVDEVMTGFFLHKRVLKRYLKHQRRLTIMEMIVTALKRLFGVKTKKK